VLRCYVASNANRSGWMDLLFLFFALYY
jgi:hypothetical protein